MTTKTDAVRDRLVRGFFIDERHMREMPRDLWLALAEWGRDLSPAASPDATPAAKPDAPCDCGSVECRKCYPGETIDPRPLKPDAPGGPSDCPYCGGHGFTMNGSEQVTCPVCKGNTYVAPPPPPETAREVVPVEIMALDFAGHSRLCDEDGCVEHCPREVIRTCIAETKAQLAARDAELAKVRAERDGEERRADLHMRINEAVSKALGQDFGASWHDLGEKVASLRARLEQKDREWDTLAEAHGAEKSRADAAEARATEAERKRDELRKRADSAERDSLRYRNELDALTDAVVRPDTGWRAQLDAAESQLAAERRRVEELEQERRTIDAALDEFGTAHTPGKTLAECVEDAMSTLRLKLAYWRTNGRED